MPPEEHLIRAIENAKLMLDCGFTSLYSAASCKWRTEIVLRNAINAGKIVGPRLRAASPEIVSTGGLGDELQLHMPHQGIEIVADGADEVRKVVRTLIREGVDTIKINISGDNLVRRGFGRQTSYTDAEVAAAAEEAHARSCWLSCHARADGAVRLALKHKFRVIYHCDFIEGDTFDLLEAAKDNIFLGPGHRHHLHHRLRSRQFRHHPRNRRAHGNVHHAGDAARSVYGELRKRGLRILPGGDYGFAWNPIGTNARDLEHFVNLLGFTPAETLMAATKWGGQIMDMPDLGLVKPGFLADLLLVRGDPTQDVSLFQDRDNLLMIMKDGGLPQAAGPGPERGDQRTAARTRLGLAVARWRAGAVWRGYDQAGLDAQYNNRARFPNFSEHFDVMAALERRHPSTPCPPRSTLHSAPAAGGTHRHLSRPSSAARRSTCSSTAATGIRWTSRTTATSPKGCARTALPRWSTISAWRRRTTWTRSCGRIAPLSRMAVAARRRTWRRSRPHLRRRPFRRRPSCGDAAGHRLAGLRARPAAARGQGRLRHRRHLRS